MNYFLYCAKYNAILAEDGFIPVNQLLNHNILVFTNSIAATKGCEMFMSNHITPTSSYLTIINQTTLEQATSSKCLPFEKNVFTATLRITKQRLLEIMSKLINKADATLVSLKNSSTKTSAQPAKVVAFPPETPAVTQMKKTTAPAPKPSQNINSYPATEKSADNPFQCQLGELSAILEKATNSPQPVPVTTYKKVAGKVVIATHQNNDPTTFIGGINTMTANLVFNLAQATNKISTLPSQIKECDQEINDLLHLIELEQPENLNTEQVISRLNQIRNQRRSHKDEYAIASLLFQIRRAHV